MPTLKRPATPLPSQSSSRSQACHAGKGFAEEGAVYRVEDDGDHDRTPLFDPLGWCLAFVSGGRRRRRKMVSSEPESYRLTKPLHGTEIGSGRHGMGASARALADLKSGRLRFSRCGARADRPHAIGEYRRCVVSQKFSGRQIPRAPAPSQTRAKAILVLAGDNRLIGQPDGAYSRDDGKTGRARLDDSSPDYGSGLSACGDVLRGREK
jgi:hypothetical protein